MVPGARCGLAVARLDQMRITAEEDNSLLGAVISLIITLGLVMFLF